MKTHLIFTAIILSFFTQIVNASPESKYSLGVSTGNTSFSNNDTYTYTDNISETTSIFGLLNITEKYKIEAALTNLGTYSTSLWSNSFKAMTVSMVGISDNYFGFKGFLKGGYSIVSMKQTIFSMSNYENSSTGDAISASAGLLFSPSFMKSMSLRLSYDHYYFKTMKVFSSNEIDNNLSAVSLGILINL